MESTSVLGMFIILLVLWGLIGCFYFWCDCLLTTELPFRKTSATDNDDTTTTLISIECNRRNTALPSSTGGATSRRMSLTVIQEAQRLVQPTPRSYGHRGPPPVDGEKVGQQEQASLLTSSETSTTLITTENENALSNSAVNSKGGKEKKITFNDKTDII